MRDHHCIVATIAASVLIGPLSARAVQAEDSPCETLTGTFATTPVLQCPDSPLGVCTKGTLEGGLKGEYMFAFTRVDPASGDSGKRDFAGFTVITTEAGTVRTADTGQLDSGMMMDDTGYMAAGAATEATGTFAGKQVTLMVTGGLSAMGTKGTYRAMVCTPASAPAAASMP